MTIGRIVHRGAAMAVAALVLLRVEMASVADVTVTQEVTTTVGESKTTLTQTTYVTKDKMRTADPTGRVIIGDLEAKTITILDPEQKQYIVQSLEDMKKWEAALPAEFREMKLSVQETGEKKTIEGYPCEKFVFKMGPTDVTVWATDKIAVDAAAAEFNTKFLELTKDVKSLNLQAQMGSALLKRKLTNYVAVIETPLPFAGQTQRIESKVKKVSYEKIDPSVFAIPEGYKRMGLPAMPAAK